MNVSYAIASDLSYQVLQRRRGLNELMAPPLNEINSRRYGRRLAAEFLPIEDTGDAAQPNPKSIAVGEQD